MMVHANGVELCVETYGDPADPAILLIMGTAASMLGWNEEFCERLAAGSRFVIRYDHRDTGQSVSYEPGAPGYTLRDLAADAVGLLDTFGLARTHIVGMSLGGGIGQLIALDHPERVASLTLISSTPGGPGPENPDLPPPSEEFLAFVTTADVPNWSNRAAVIDYIAAAELACVSRSRPIDEAAFRAKAARVLDRTVNIVSSMSNHFAMDSGGPWRERLGQISAPTLVIHGADDPVFPFMHGEALAAEISGARLLRLERTGHELPEFAWETVVPAILEHTSAS